MPFLLAGGTKINVDVPHTDIGTAVHNIVNTLILAAGILAVVFVLVGAFQYVVSGGNPEATRKAKDTILFALIGAVVAMVAYAIVNFVITRTP